MTGCLFLASFLSPVRDTRQFLDTGHFYVLAHAGRFAGRVSTQETGSASPSAVARARAPGPGRPPPGRHEARPHSIEHT